MAVLELKPQIRLANGSYSSHYAPVYTLEGRRYGFRFYTFVSDANITPLAPDSWALDLFDPDTNENTISGIKLASGPDLFAFYRYKGNLIPPGVLSLLDLRSNVWDRATLSFTTIRGSDPNAQDFEEQNFALLYVTSDEAFG